MKFINKYLKMKTCLFRNPAWIGNNRQLAFTPESFFPLHWSDSISHQM